jgi:hypothetical protein
MSCIVENKVGWHYTNLPEWTYNKPWIAQEYNPPDEIQALLDARFQLKIIPLNLPEDDDYRMAKVWSYVDDNTIVVYARTMSGYSAWFIFKDSPSMEEYFSN